MLRKTVILTGRIRVPQEGAPEVKAAIEAALQEIARRFEPAQFMEVCDWEDRFGWRVPDESEPAVSLDNREMCSTLALPREDSDEEW